MLHLFPAKRSYRDARKRILEISDAIKKECKGDVDVATVDHMMEYLEVDEIADVLSENERISAAFALVKDELKELKKEVNARKESFKLKVPGQ